MQGVLRGKLEELGLEEIVRLLCISRRTGILTLRQREREAVLRFRDGLLVGATSSQQGPFLGELLVRRGVVGQEEIDRALVLQHRESGGVPLGVILRSRFGVELRQLEPVVREQLALVVTPLLDWSQGEYDFVPQAAMETVDAAYLDPLRLLEDRTAAPAPPSAAATEPAGLPQSGRQVSTPTVVLADDDRDLGRCLVRGLAEEYSVIALTVAEEAPAEIERLCRNGIRPAVVVDLIMPRRDGSGMLAGLDLIRVIRERFPDLALVAVTDFHHAGAAAEVAAVGCRLLAKPRRGDLQGEPFARFFGELREFLRGTLPGIS